MTFKAYDGKTGQQIQRICDEGVPNPLFTNTNVLKLKFKAAKLNLFSRTYLYDITYIASDKGRGCGGEVFNYAGVFTSPGYPNTDRNVSDCIWTINVPQNLKVAISFSGKYSTFAFLSLKLFIDLLKSFDCSLRYGLKTIVRQ